MTEVAPEERIQRKRTMGDKAISWLNGVRYSCTEPTLLRFARWRHQGNKRAFERDPLISVYIPTYNRADLLRERAIPTVLNQTYQNFELWIVGDCCTDNTSEVVRSFGDPRIHFYNLPVRKKRYPDLVELHWLAGPVIAANEALRRLRGEWIARLDDDDLWSANHLESLLRFAQSEQYEFVSAQCEFVRYGTKEIDWGRGALDPYYTRKPAPPGRYNPKIGATQTWLYRSYLRCFRYNIHCWRKSWNKVNDLDISIRMFSAGVYMGFLEQVVATILPRPGEDTVGVDAYTAQRKEKATQFRF
jgi:glycosyltransferase involved in cell wall biosynthesis